MAGLSLAHQRGNDMDNPGMDSTGKDRRYGPWDLGGFLTSNSKLPRSERSTLAKWLFKSGRKSFG